VEADSVIFSRSSPALSSVISDTETFTSRSGSPMLISASASARSSPTPDLMMMGTVSASSAASSTCKKPHLEGLAPLKRENKSEYRRQVHVRSEQQRREKIKSSIHALQAQLPDFVLSTVKSLRLSKTATIKLAIKAIEGWSSRIQDLENEIIREKEMLRK
jgi:hypothetical protein